MSAASAPLRLSLAGGGTDLPEHYQRWGCHLLAVAIAYRVCAEVTATRPGRLVLRTPDGEWSGGSTDDLPSGEIRCALEEFGVTTGVRVEVRSDVPSGVGLGGSGAMLVALVGALSAFLGRAVDAATAADLAFAIERHRAGRPVGHQDHVTAAYGGLVRLKIDRAGVTQVSREARLFEQVNALLDRGLLLFRTPVRRSAASVLSQHAAGLRSGTAAAGMAEVSSLRGALERALAAGSVERLGELLDRHWQAKRASTPATTSAAIDHWYAAARTAGALGGKLVGAGGGGFFLLAVPPTRVPSVQDRLAELALTRWPVTAEADGLRIERDSVRARQAEPAVPVKPAS